jgi:hypothetical protein
MRRSLVIALLASLPGVAWALEGVEPALRAQTQAVVSAATAGSARAAEAPFRLRRDPMPELILRDELARRGPRPGCDVAADVCYDLVEGRVVYRPARALLPAVEGLRPESVSLRRDRIVLRYSFR